VYALRLAAPYSLVMVANPLVAAALLTWREAGPAGVKRLLARAFDYRRIEHRSWYFPILLLMPALMALEYAWLRWTGAPVMPVGVPLPMLSAYLLVFLALAIGEEVGWSGYALDPVQERYGALAAGVLIGAVWGLWHLVPYLLANTPSWAAGQFATTVLIRVLMVWIYNNTGGSVFGMVLFHAIINLAEVPDYGFRYDPVLMSLLLAVTTAVVVFLWGPRTLAEFRYARRPEPGTATGTLPPGP
jgi:membrane protease YdiL (CAAX protease family)